MNYVPEGLIWGSKHRVKHTLSKFADKTKWGGTVSRPEDRVVFERDIDKLKESSQTEIS